MVTLTIIKLQMDLELFIPVIKYMQAISNRVHLTNMGLSYFKMELFIKVRFMLAKFGGMV